MPSGTSVASPNGIPWDGEVVDPNEKANRLWRMEDGATDGPAASSRQEIDMVRAFRTGEIQRPRTGGGKTIEDAERWWLSLHEYARRHGPSDVVLPERGSVDWWYCVFDFVRTLIDGHDRTELEPVAAELEQRLDEVYELHQELNRQPPPIAIRFDRDGNMITGGDDA